MSRGGSPAVARCALGLCLVSFAIALGSNVGLSVVLERSGADGLPTLMMLHAGLLAATTVVVASKATCGR